MAKEMYASFIVVHLASKYVVIAVNYAEKELG